MFRKKKTVKRDGGAPSSGAVPSSSADLETASLGESSLLRISIRVTPMRSIRLSSALNRGIRWSRCIRRWRSLRPTATQASAG